MFGWEFPPHISGGLGTACYGITKGLVKLGQEVVFVMPRIKSPEKFKHFKILSALDYCPTGVHLEGGGEEDTWGGNLKLRKVDSLLRPYMSVKQYEELLSNITGESGAHLMSDKYAPGHYGPDIWMEVARYGRAAEKIARSETFDLIHGHDWTSVSACVNAQRTSGKPYVYHAHALEFDRSGENINQDIYNIEKYGMEKAARVIAVSHYTQEKITSRYGIDPAKITVIHNAVSRHDSQLGEIYPKKDNAEKIVLFLGRITHQKGPESFIEAAACVLQYMPEVRFVMAGTGDLMVDMIEKVAEKGIGRMFHFTGFLQKEEAERIYARSDIYVMPSVSEPFGISPLEAMLFDVPVIISKQSGVSELLKHALKVDFGDIEALADKIISLLKHPCLAEELTNAGREELKKIKWEYAAAKILAVYQQVIN